MEEGNKFVSVAELNLKFHTKTPQRFRSKRGGGSMGKNSMIFRIIILKLYIMQGVLCLGVIFPFSSNQRKIILLANIIMFLIILITSYNCYYYLLL